MVIKLLQSAGMMGLRLALQRDMQIKNCETEARTVVHKLVSVTTRDIVLQTLNNFREVISYNPLKWLPIFP
jgi:hypothetical protein